MNALCGMGLASWTQFTLSRQSDRDKVGVQGNLVLPSRIGERLPPLFLPHAFALITYRASPLIGYGSYDQSATTAFVITSQTAHYLP